MLFAEHPMSYCAPPTCQWIGDPVFESFKEGMWKEAQSLIENRWAAIRAVAEALIDRQMLTGDEVREMISLHPVVSGEH
jgi:hypothetical protein